MKLEKGKAILLLAAIAGVSVWFLTKDSNTYTGPDNTTGAEGRKQADLDKQTRDIQARWDAMTPAERIESAKLATKGRG